MFKVIASGIIALTSFSAHAYTLFDYDAHYSASLKGFTVGKIEQSLRHNGDLIVLKNEAQTSGAVSLFKDKRVKQRSSFMIGANYIKPVSYSYSDPDKYRRNVNLDFNWHEQRVSDSYSRNNIKLPQDVEVLDKLSYQVAMMRDLSKGHTSLSYLAHNGREFKPYNLEVIADERLKTKLGWIDTKVIKLVRDGNKKTTLLWVAPSLNYIPVKLLHDNGKGQKVVAIITLYKITDQKQITL